MIMMWICWYVSLCRGLDHKLKLLLDDANHYIRPHTTLPLPDTSDEPFDRFADKKQITDFLQNACENCITKWVCSISMLLKI